MPRPSDRMEGHVSSWLKLMGEREKAERREPTRPFITISRECGAFGTTIADRLVEELLLRERRRSAAWAVLDNELVQKVIEEHRLPVVFEKYFTQSATNRLQDVLEDFFGVHPPQETLVRKMSETILHLASLGYVILVDQGAGIITRALPGGTHVRLIGSLAKRVAHMTDYLNLPEKQAHEYVTNEDRDRRDYIKRYFKVEISDPSLYDAVINTDTVPLEKVAAIIADMVIPPKP